VIYHWFSLSYLENLVALSHISELHTLLRKLSHTHTHTHALHELSLLLKIFYLQENFCAYWLLTLIISWYIFEMLFNCFISYLYMRVLHISLCFLASIVKRLDGHVLASGRARLCRSLIWQHAVQTSMYHVQTRAFCFLYQIHTTTFCLFYHVVLCVFCLGLIPRFWHSLHIFSHSQVFPLTFLILLSFSSF